MASRGSSSGTSKPRGSTRKPKPAAPVAPAVESLAEYQQLVPADIRAQIQAEILNLPPGYAGVTLAARTLAGHVAAGNLTRYAADMLLDFLRVELQGEAVATGASLEPKKASIGNVINFNLEAAVAARDQISAAARLQLPAHEPPPAVLEDLDRERHRLDEALTEGALKGGGV